MADGENGDRDCERDETYKPWGAVAREAIEESERFMQAARLPMMRTPTGFGESYEFPVNAAQLTSLELGDTQVKLAGYYTYTLQLIGEQDAALGATRTAYEISLGMQMHSIQEGRGTGKGSRVLKENLRAMAISDDPMLRRATEQLIAREATVVRLKAQSEVYGEQLTRLSREQTRREMEARIG